MVFTSVVSLVIGAVCAVALLYFADVIISRWRKIKWVRKRRIENNGRPDIWGMYIPLIEIEHSWDDRAFRAFEVTKDKNQNEVRNYDTYGWGDHPMDAVFDLLVNMKTKKEEKHDERR